MDIPDRKAPGYEDAGIGRRGDNPALPRCQSGSSNSTIWLTKKIEKLSSDTVVARSLHNLTLRTSHATQLSYV